MLCFYFTSLCDWSKKLTPLSQPIRCKIEETNMEALALWLVQKTCTTLLTNQMQNWRNKYGSTCSVIGPENMHHPLNQSDAKLKKQIWKHLLCDWSRKHAPLSQPIRCKIEEMNMEALALWLVQKTCTTLLTNQMQN